jgi:hypothetical protein
MASTPTASTNEDPIRNLGGSFGLSGCRPLYRSASTQLRKIVGNNPDGTLFDPNQNVSFTEN